MTDMGGRSLRKNNLVRRTVKTIDRTRYYVYQCTTSSETRGTRTSQKPDKFDRVRKEPCGNFGIHRTRREVTRRSGHQAECKHCLYRKRLNPANVKEIYDEAEAMRRVARKNRELVA